MALRNNLPSPAATESDPERKREGDISCQTENWAAKEY